MIRKVVPLVVLTILLAKINAYTVPRARIEVLHPRGFSVSIPDTPGIQIFAFHGNLNSPMEGLEAGQFSADILKHRNGRWTFTDKRHEIKAGDVLYYWLYVQKDGLGYRRDDQRHDFTDLDIYGLNNATESSIDEQTEPQTLTPKTERTTKVPPTNPSNCNASTPPLKLNPQEVHHHHHHYFPNFTGDNLSGKNENIAKLEEQIRQLTESLDNLKFRLTSLTEVVEDLIQQSDLGTKLLLTGAKIDAGTNLFELLRYVLLERLELKDLKNDIYSATRTKEGVVFDVASALDKKRILTRSKERFIDDEDIRIVDYYVDSSRGSEGGATGELSSLVDVRFGGD